MTSSRYFSLLSIIALGFALGACGVFTLVAVPADATSGWFSSIGIVACVAMPIASLFALTTWWKELPR